MKQPTHFIEVFKFSEFGRVRQANCLPIKFLQGQLRFSKINGITTIAVWKIYPKDEKKAAS